MSIEFDEQISSKKGLSDHFKRLPGEFFFRKGWQETIKSLAF
jgi:hypothetical protein